MRLIILFTVVTLSLLRPFFFFILQNNGAGFVEIIDNIYAFDVSNAVNTLIPCLTWMSFVATYDFSTDTMTNYANGLFVNSFVTGYASLWNPSRGTSGLVLGSPGAPAYTQTNWNIMSGSLANFMEVNRILTPAEIWDLYYMGAVTN